MSLKEKLDALREGSAKRIPEAVRATMHRATEDLRQSGILDRVLGVGAPLPEFALVNTRGETVRSADLRARGPVVLTIYRGLW